MWHDAVMLDQIPAACPRCQNRALQVTPAEVNCQLCGWQQILRPSERPMASEPLTEAQMLAQALKERLEKISDEQHKLARERIVITYALRRLRSGERTALVRARMDKFGVKT